MLGDIHTKLYKNSIHNSLYNLEILKFFNYSYSPNLWRESQKSAAWLKWPNTGRVLSRISAVTLYPSNVMGFEDLRIRFPVFWRVIRTRNATIKLNKVTHSLSCGDGGGDGVGGQWDISRKLSHDRNHFWFSTVDTYLTLIVSSDKFSSFFGPQKATRNIFLFSLPAPYKIN